MMKKQTMAIVITLQAAAIAYTSNDAEASRSYSRSNRGPVISRVYTAGDTGSTSSHHCGSHHGPHHGLHPWPVVPPSPRPLLNSAIANKDVADTLEQARDGAAAAIEQLTCVYKKCWETVRHRPTHREESALLEHAMTLPFDGEEIGMTFRGDVAPRLVMAAESRVSTTEAVLNLLAEHGRLVGHQAAITAFMEIVAGEDYTRKHRPHKHHKHESDESEEADEGAEDEV